MVTKMWRVYGADGHRQRESFNKSTVYDFSNNEATRIIRVLNADLTGTHEYSEVIISRDTAKECEEELYGQLCDGIFENSRFGRVVEFSMSAGRVGKWIFDEEEGIFRCDKCGNGGLSYDDFYLYDCAHDNYCSNCGTMMDNGGETDE